MSFVQALLGGPASRKVVNAEPLTWQALLAGQGLTSKSGEPISLWTALGCSAVLGGARVLAEDISKVPCCLYKKTGKNKDKAYGHSLFDIINRQPNEWMTSFEFRETMMYHAVLSNGGFAWKNRSRNGQILELIPMLAGSVRIEQAPGYGITYYVSGPDGRAVTMTRDEVMHFRGVAWNGFQGLDWTILARESIGLSLATEEAHSRLHRNGARPAGLLSTDQGLNKELKEKLRLEWLQTFGGANKFGTAVLDKGIKYQQLAMTGVDTEHIATRKFQIEEIARQMRVLPAKIGHHSGVSTRPAAEQDSIDHVRDSLQPWATRLEQVMDRDLLTAEERRAGYYCRLELQGLMRGDTAAQTGYYKSGINDGWLTRNEARAAENLNPIDGLDLPLMPLNMGDGTAAPVAPGAPSSPVDEGPAPAQQ